MMRPHIICHMTMSLDGKVTGSFLEQSGCAPAIDVYYQVNRALESDAFACGRVTMESSFTGGVRPDLTAFSDAQISREDYVAEPDAGFYAVSFDRRGRVGWQGPRIEDDDPGYGGAHIIEVLCEDVPDAYLAYLQSVGVSYIFAGKTELDLLLALDKLCYIFGIGSLLLEGGSVLNGVFQRAGVIDELSLIVAPVIAAAEDKPLFDGGTLENYRLAETEQYENGVLRLHYKKI